MAIRLIGAGMPRTGTLTQKTALEMLGYDPCYHWVNVLADLDQVDLWRNALAGSVDWDSVFAGFGATVDWPGGYFWRELTSAYPDAKVLLSERDPEAWERSFRQTIWSMGHGESLLHLLSGARALVDPRWQRYVQLVEQMFWSAHGTFATGHERPEQLIEAFEAHNAAVKREIPAERLLVWQVSEGWEPLCDFLEVPVPREQMPHVNDRETFLGRVIDGAIETLAAARGLVAQSPSASASASAS